MRGLSLTNRSKFGGLGQLGHSPWKDDHTTVCCMQFQEFSRAFDVNSVSYGDGGDACHYTFVKTHRMYNTKSEP